MTPHLIRVKVTGLTSAVRPLALCSLLFLWPHLYLLSCSPTLPQELASTGYAPLFCLCILLPLCTGDPLSRTLALYIYIAPSFTDFNCLSKIASPGFPEEVILHNLHTV